MCVPRTEQLIMRARRRPIGTGGILACALSVLGAFACGAAAPVALVSVEPKPRLPILTAMTVILAADTLPASATTVARVTAVDDKARPVTVGLIA